MTALSEPERLVRDALREADPTVLKADSEHAGAARSLVAALRPLLAAETDVNANRLVQVARAMGMVGPETVPFGTGFEGMVMAARQGREAVEAMEQRPGAVDPEIVTAREAAELLPNSVVRPCNGVGDSSPRDRPLIIGVDMIDLRDPTAYHRVLSRAPVPAPKVGDVVRTETELERLPNGTVVRTHTGLTAERWDAEDWWLMGADGTVPPGNLRLPARVLDLGGDS